MRRRSKGWGNTMDRRAANQLLMQVFAAIGVEFLLMMLTPSPPSFHLHARPTQSDSEGVS